jgi:hypothetical protein
LIKITSDNINETLIFNYPFSEKWQLYYGDFSKTPDFLINNKQVFQTDHFHYNEYNNGWNISKAKPDKSITLTLVFKPHGQYLLSDLIGYFIFTVLILFSTVAILLRKNE